MKERFGLLDGNSPSKQLSSSNQDIPDIHVSSNKEDISKKQVSSDKKDCSSNKNSSVNFKTLILIV